MDKKEIVKLFQVPEAVVSVEGYGSGHINDTYLVITELGKRYILQAMNQSIFQNVEALMENILGVTEYLKGKIVEQGGDPQRETLNVIPDMQGRPFVCTEDGKVYRMYRFIEDATCYDQVKDAQDFYQSAVAFGNFQALLSEYPADSLHETIPDFHNTVKRFEALKAAVDADVMGRASKVEKEIAFAYEREAKAHVLIDLQQEGKLPLRVTHNDTKLNNIMMDNATGKGICVIDLDTVMPGLAVNDFGDSIRFGANTAAEDELDLGKVSLDMGLFETYVKGFAEGCRGQLSKEEMKQLPMGAWTMTYECGIRFLTDYLQGDTYFKIHRPEHNLDRCRTQFALVADMERKWDEMCAVVEKYC